LLTASIRRQTSTDSPEPPENPDQRGFHPDRTLVLACSRPWAGQRFDQAMEIDVGYGLWLRCAEAIDARLSLVIRGF